MSPESPSDRLLGTVRRKAKRMASARRDRQTFWLSLVHVGVLGWVFVIPVVLCAFAGRLIAHATGRASLGVGLILLGVGVGGYAVWRQLRPNVHDPEEEQR